MSFELINLTLPTVLREIDDVLNEYPEHPYKSAFSIHEFRQKLVAQILSHVPNQYANQATPPQADGVWKQICSRILDSDCKPVVFAAERRGIYPY